MDAWQTAGLILGVLTGGLGVITVCCAAFVKGWRFARRVGRLLDHFLGYGEGVDRVAGLVERMHVMSSQLERVRAEVLPNGGGSLRDAVDELRARFEAYVDMHERSERREDDP